MIEVHLLFDAKSVMQRNTKILQLNREIDDIDNENSNFDLL